MSRPAEKMDGLDDVSMTLCIFGLASMDFSLVDMAWFLNIRLCCIVVICRCSEYLYGLFKLLLRVRESGKRESESVV